MLNAIAKPFGWLMMRLYEFTGNYGIAVILFALVVKLILLPFQMKSKRGMMQQQRLQPQLKELEKKHGANKQKYSEEVQKLYKEEGVNPMSGCIWSLIPFPILIALYQAIRFPLTIMMGLSETLLEEGGVIYEFLANSGFVSSANSAYVQISQSQWLSNHVTEFQNFISERTDLVSTGIEKFTTINYNFLGLDLGAKPGIKWLFSAESWSDPSYWLPMLGLFLIPIVAGILTYLSSKISMATSGQQQEGAPSMGAMNIFMPLLTVYFAFIMPGALGIYWIAGSLFGIIQDVILNRYYGRKFALEDAEFKARMAAREKAYEAKRQETERLKAMNATERNENTSSRKKRTAERQQQLEKAREYEKRKNNESTEVGPSQVGQRKYARGRAYDPERYADNGVEGAVSSDDTLVDDETEELLDNQAELCLDSEPEAAGGDSEAQEPEDADETEDTEPVEDTEDTDEEETDD